MAFADTLREYGRAHLVPHLLSHREHVNGVEYFMLNTGRPEDDELFQQCVQTVRKKNEKEKN